MCGYALKLVNIRKVYFILPNAKFGGLVSLMNIKGVDFEQVDYRTTDVIGLLKDFYKGGNTRLKPEDRHRKPNILQIKESPPSKLKRNKIAVNKNKDNPNKLLKKRAEPDR